MNEAVQIRRLTAHYRLRPSQSEQKLRLDSVLRDVIGDALDMALERAGIRTEEVVCIRRLDVPIRLRLSRGDGSLAADWARFLAEAIEFAATKPYATVRYRSRRLALIAMGSDVAQGRLHNVWAWHQIGFWRGSDDCTNLVDAASEFAGALCREPEAAVAVLAALGARGELRPMAKYLDVAWTSIAAAVFDASGVSLPHEVDRLTAPWKDDEHSPTVEFEAARSSGSQLKSPAWDRAKIVVERSSILRDLRDTQLAQPAAKALALLALLECEPSLVRAGNQLLETARAVYELEFPRAQFASFKERLSTEVARLRVQSPTGANRAPRKSEKLALRTEGFAGFGGLLYLLRVVDELKIPERAMALPAIAARRLRWFQHRLALTLLPMDPDDPAALAFCGLGPASNHPSRLQPPPAPEEQQLIDAFAAEVETALAEFFPEAARLREQLAKFVCRRPAHIVADPGWIEARFSLQDVSVEIRRTGLDIDPDYLPWLGVVVRFVYE
jgi:hypothetical protein